MMNGPPRFIDWVIGLPIPLLALFVFAFWTAIAVWVHRFLVPRIAGEDGQKIGKFEAEVASQLGIVLGLLLSFNAVSVWEQTSAAREATLTEASALREVADLLPELPAAQQPALRETLRTYLTHVVKVEWPQLGQGQLGLARPTALRDLSRMARASGISDLHDAVSTAVSAREQRIRIATNRMLAARWSIVMVLGTMTLVAIGLLHAENRRARVVAISLITFAIASCFVVLLVQVRPFYGALALQPNELSALQRDLDTDPPH